ncbi:MAG: hypothetical protein ICCCNLDF_02811 [Planctomycetes bacterium]|nr:hypothetical protein [Planctomycetota bacterium]
MNQLLERRRGVQPAVADRAQASPAQARAGAAQAAAGLTTAPSLSVSAATALMVLSRLAQRPSRASTRLSARISTRLVSVATAVAVIGGVSAPTIDYGSPAQAVVGESYSLTPTTTGHGITFSSGTLPSGLTLDTATGRISGTPTQEGEYTFTVTATNAGGSTSATVTLTVAYDYWYALPSGGIGTSGASVEPDAVVHAGGSAA